MSIKFPLISVILPAYNSSRYLHENIQSILHQSLKDFELIIINDGSTDDSLSIMRSFTDKRIKIIDLPENKGIPIAMNAGMDVATGKYIAIANADDVYLPARFAKQMGYFKTTPGTRVCSAWYQAFGDATFIATLPESDKEIRAQMLFICPICHPLAMFDGVYFKERGIRYDEFYKYALDYALWLRLAREFPDCGFGNVQEVLGKYRCHADNVSTAKFNQQTAFAMDAQKQFLEALCNQVSEQECIFQASMYFNQLGCHNEEHVMQLRNWLLRLKACNLEKKLMDPASFRQVLQLVAKQIAERNQDSVPRAATLLKPLIRDSKNTEKREPVK